VRANLIAALIGMLCVVGCGGGGGSSVSTGAGSGSGTTPTGSNVQPVIVDSGPTVVANSNTPAVNTLYTSVTICSPGSTTNCQTIDHIQVDTGSSGVRILSSALALTLPQENDSNGLALGECVRFVDGSAWGMVRMADIKISGETASNQPVHVVGDNTYASPSDCANTEATVTSFGANGILGVGPFMQDCGPGCAAAPATPGIYYTCVSTNNPVCSAAATPATLQVSNPVTAFTTDNNGVIIQVPAVNGTAASASGYLIFGIGTEGNNGIGSAQVFTLDGTGALKTTYKNSTLSGSFIDSGSNGYFFNDNSITMCTTNTGFFCPSSTLNLTGTIVGINGTSAAVNFTVVNADTLFSTSTTTIAAVAGLAGSASSANTSSGGGSPLSGFDWGLPFYYGRSVYTAIETMNTSAGMGPYFAF
jgi:Protein of unknown function (DUF3443)